MQAAMWAVNLLSAVLIVLACLLALCSVVLMVQVFASRLPARRTAPAPTPGRPRVALLVPAHDEERGIAATLIGLQAQMQPGDRLLVVADNCTDDTAAIALAQVAEVVVRHDTLRRGKGYALDRGVQHLALDPPEIVVIVDADCQLHPGCIDTLVRSCAQSSRPVQALYLMHSPPGAGLLSRIGEFAWIVKNKVRPLGYHRLGLPCQLMGTGMAFPWALLKGTALASGHIVEDMQLGVALSKAGAPPMFCPEALVTSTFPSSTDGLSAQRTRWEHGHIAVLLSEGPSLLWQGLRRGELELVAMALDLCVPPLASLVLSLVALVLADAAFGALTGHWWAGTVALIALALLTISVLAAWQQYGRAAISLRELLSAPWYVINKLPLYARLLLRRQTRWVRTERDDGASRR